MFQWFDDNFNMTCPPDGVTQQRLCLRCAVRKQEWWVVDEMGASSPPRRWSVLGWQAATCPTCAITASLSEWWWSRRLVLTAVICCRLSEVLCISEVFVALYQLVIFFFFTDKFKITDNPVGIKKPGGEGTAATKSLAVSLSGSKCASCRNNLWSNQRLYWQIAFGLHQFLSLCCPFLVQSVFCSSIGS